MSIFESGLDNVLAVVREEVEWLFGDWSEGQGIGSSDISACVRNVINSLTGVDIWSSNVPEDFVSDVELTMIRNAVNNAMSEVLA